ncbi:von Willebrand factor type EGF and pentraxin domain-containing 1-like, partial [Brachionus plicatilis]
IKIIYFSKDSIGFKTKIECTTVEVVDLIKYSFANSNYSNPIEHCVSQGKPVTIIQNNDYFCSERNYSVSGLDYSRALCDRTCFFDEPFECGGSPYYLRSVSNFNIESPIITGDFYFEFLGCYTLSTPDDYLILENSTIITCSKYCSYLNLTMVASGKYCFCLQSVNLTLRVGENNCSNYKLFDRHYSGENNFYGVYKILGFNKTSVPDQNGTYTKISFGSSYFHSVITEAFETSSTCFNFCLFKQYKYFAFDQQKRYCYCGNLQNFIVTNVDTFIDIFMHENSEFSTEISFSSINTITSFPNLNLETTQILSQTFNENNNFTNRNITENSTIEQVKNALYDIEPVFIAEILNKATYDISGCLVNCSNKGFCTIKDNKFQCLCKDEYYGSSCEKTNNPCDQKIQCLNNGTCIFIKNEKLNFRCECSSNFYGSHCENAIDLCENVTCSGNGYCQEDENKVPKCKCFKYYKGDRCEEIEPALQTINTVIRTSTIIAAVLSYAVLANIFKIKFYSAFSFNDGGELPEFREM